MIFRIDEFKLKENYKLTARNHKFGKSDGTIRRNGQVKLLFKPTLNTI